MSWINKAERKYGRFAIPRIVHIVAGFQVLVYALIVVTNGSMITKEGFNPESLEAKLILDPAKVFQGEVWRLVTFLFIPRTMNPIFLLIGVMFTVFIANALEALWGAFRMNVYVVAGALFMMLGTFLLLRSMGSENPLVPIVASKYVNSATLALSLFLAFAVLFPNYEILAMMIIPIKAKWLGLVSGGFVFFQYLDAGKIPLGLGMSPGIIRILILLGLMNFIFFALPRAITAMRERSSLAARRQRFEAAKLPKFTTFHECKVCGKSEVDDRELEFRVAADGEEYCVPCLDKIRSAEEESESAEEDGGSKA